jgi:hypothetical protein
MKHRGPAVATLMLVGLMAPAADADYVEGARIVRTSPVQGAPAPLLAAGVPAFLALGTGVIATKLIRGFRNRKK